MVTGSGLISGGLQVKQRNGRKRVRRDIKTISIKDSAHTGHKHRNLREAEVISLSLLYIIIYHYKVKLISAAECQKNLKGVINKVLPSHVCGFTPGWKKEAPLANNMLF